MKMERVKSTMKKIILLVCFILLFFVVKTFANGPGTTNANFLKAGQGVRPIAMGETYIALGDGLDTLYWNPAGLVQITSPVASFIHSFWVQDIGTEYLAYGMPLGPLGTVGGGITYMHAGTIEQTLEDEFGNYAGVGGEASSMSLALVGVYSQKLACLMPIKDPFLSKLLVGASLRIITESIDEVSVFGGGVDIGVIWRETEEVKLQQLATAKGTSKQINGKPVVRDNGLRLGFVVQNLGVTSDQLMPINFRAGVGYVLQDLFSPFGRGTIALDALVPIDNDIKISIGTEYAHISPNTEFAIRFGYKIGNEIKDLDAMAGLTVGAGCAVIAGFIKYQVDYAFVPYGDLGSTHRASLTLSFLPVKNVVKNFSQGKPVLVAPVANTSASDLGLAVQKETTEKAEEKAEKKSEDKHLGKAMQGSGTPKVAVAANVAGSAADIVEATVGAGSTPEMDQTQKKIKKLRRGLKMFLKRVGARMLSPISFERGRTEFSPKTKKTLDKLGKFIEKHPDGNIVIIGYAGSETELAEARAKAVVRYLKMSFRIDPDRLLTKAGDPAQKPKNSFISFEVLEPKP